jgi:CRISPR-associated protein Cmr1
MARKIPPCPAQAASVASGVAQPVCKTYDIYVVTPLVGGGAEAKKNDPLTIRVPGIRGQLRFWWRATRGAAFATAAELYRREVEIWGSDQQPSAVSVTVRNIRKGQQKPWAKYMPDNKNGGVKSLPEPVEQNFPAYALFPFQGETKKNGDIREVTEPPSIVTCTAQFTLELMLPTHEQLQRSRALENAKRAQDNLPPLPQIADITLDVEAAVWAWVNFGGLGSRTRRGCGTLFCKDLSPQNSKTIANWYKENLDKYQIAPPATPRDWPTLPASFLSQQAQHCLAAWNSVVSLLRDFRQLPVGRNPGTNGRPGRSRWPEAESLRMITSRGASKYMEILTTDQDAFPRAEFGLPIIFHFQSKDDPQDPMVLPVCQEKTMERMSSPLLLKPLAISQQQAVPIVLHLATKPLTDIEVQYKGGEQTLGQDYIRHPDLATYPKSPMGKDAKGKLRSPAGSALEAFLAFAREQGYC